MSEDKKISVARFAGDVYDLDLRVYEALGSSLGRVFTADRKRNVKAVEDAITGGREHIVRSEVALIGNMARTIPDPKVRREIMGQYSQLMKTMNLILQGYRDEGIRNQHKAELDELNLKERFGKTDNLIICIGRSYGCGGEYIGFGLADTLHADYYDAEILSAILKSREERPDNSASSESGSDDIKMTYNWQDTGKNVNPGLAYIEKSESVKEHIHKINICHGLPPRDAIFFHQTDLILDLAKRKNFIIMGRCADQILTNNNVPHISIFLTAPEELRIQRIMNLNQVDHKTAKKQVRQVDKAHASYYKYFSGKEWGDANNYDLCINTSIFGVQGTIDFILRMIGLEDRHGIHGASNINNIKSGGLKQPRNPETVYEPVTAGRNGEGIPGDTGSSALLLRASDR